MIGRNVLADESQYFNPGLARHRLRVLRPEKTQDDFGGIVISWALYATVRAQVVSLQGREFEANQERYGDAQYKIRMQHIGGIEREYKLEWLTEHEGTLDLDILDIQDIAGTSNFTQIYARNAKAA